MRYEKRDENRDIGFSTIRLRTLGARSCTSVLDVDATAPAGVWYFAHGQNRR